MQAPDVILMRRVGPPVLSPHVRRTPRVTVAVVNNTSDRALAATEAQFLTLLRSAAAGTELQVRFFTCPNIARAVPPRTTSGRAYAAVTSLFDSRVDALIVTGMEPTTPELRDEPVWRSLTRLIDWVDHEAIPSIWSCLAAHAAVLCLDGIERTRHPTKISDILSCENAARNHPLMSGLPSHWWTPHSRYYEVPEVTLAAKGYDVVSRTAAAGADLFIKKGRAPFVFFQGHPEYEHDSLLKEYKRDLRRYFGGKRDEYPVAPASYFKPETAQILAQVRQQVLQTARDPRMADQVLAIARTGTAPVRWNEVATSIYVNWMASFGLDAGRGQAVPRPPVEADVALQRVRIPEPLFNK